MAPIAKLLIVDDEKDIANLTKIWMESKGFAADTFYHPAKALESFKPDMYDLAIIDLLMPRMNGFELYEKLHKVDPKLKVCFMSASESMDQDKALLERYLRIRENKRWTFIRKPEEMEKVAEIIIKQLGS